MQLNFVLSIVRRDLGEKMLALCTKRELPLALSALAHGTATREILSLLGLREIEKTVVLTVADAENTQKLIRDARNELYIDIPGNGIMAAVPIKSIGGGRTLAYLTDKPAAAPSTPRASFDYELVVVILNEGFNEMVMEAARGAGASGGTVLHAKGTGAKRAEKFFGVSLAEEKEILLILCAANQKADVMQAILADAGADSEAGSILFSLPVDEIAGLRLGEDS